MYFSVVIPTFNRLQKLKLCLDQLKNQDFKKEDYEVIVVDDGSTDGTYDYLASIKCENPQIIVFTQKNRGPAAARNFGVKNSHGEHIAFTDDDCLVPCNWLTLLRDGFSMFPEASGVGGYLEAPKDVLSKSSIARLEYYETHTVYKVDSAMYLGGFETPTGGTNNICYKKEVFEKIGYFDENFPVPAGEDADLKLRVTKGGMKIGFIPLKVTHLDPYSSKSFFRRSIVHGIGSGFFETKYGKPPTRRGIMVQVLLSPYVFIKILLKTKDFGVSALICTKAILMAYGQYKFLRLKNRL